MMEKGRLEAFSDGVLAIIITIMVLELKVPHGADFAALQPLAFVLLSYVLSFLYVGIYWNNHHHLLKTIKHVSGGIMWANLHLLFWLSLIPFVTGWMGENHFEKLPSALYGCALLMSAVAYTILQCAIAASHGSDALVRKAVGGDFKGKLSMALYVAGIGASLVVPLLAGIIYLGTAIMWLVPDRRIEKVLAETPEH